MATVPYGVERARQRVLTRVIDGRLAAVAAVVLVSAGVALAWAFTVPMFQGADEDAHFDYAYSIYAQHGLIRATDRPLEPDPNIRHSNPVVGYLERATGFDTTRRANLIPAPPGYGTRQFFAALDAGAPTGEPQSFNPELVIGYPFGYYLLVAAWLWLVSLFTTGPVELFFAARVLSVVLFAGGVALVYPLCRRLRCGPRTALAVTAAVGLFPMSSYVGSYVQPENLAFLLTTLTALAALRLRERPGLARGCLLAIALGALLVTKSQYALCIGLPVLVMLALRWSRELSPVRVGGRLAALLLPSAALEAVHLWVTWGYHAHASPILVGQPARSVSLGGALHAGAAALAQYLAGQAVAALYDSFVLGAAAFSFWGNFGWLDTPLLIGPVWTRAIIVGVSVLVAILGAIRVAAVAVRLARLALRGRLRVAAALATANPLTAAYLLFTALLLADYVVTAGGVGGQGRYWFPLLPGVFLYGIFEAPRVLPRLRWRRALSNTLLVALLAFVAVGSVAGYREVAQRYYLNGRAVAAAPVRTQPDPLPAQAGVVAAVPSGRNLLATEVVRFDPARPVSVPDGGQVAILGWAVSGDGQLPAAVFVSLDGARESQAVVGDPVPAHGNAGFDALVDLAGVPRGEHALDVRIVLADGRYAVVPGVVRVEVVAPTDYCAPPWGYCPG